MTETGKKIVDDYFTKKGTDEEISNRITAFLNSKYTNKGTKKLWVVLGDERTDNIFVVHCQTDCEYYHLEGCYHTDIKLDEKDNCLSYKKKEVLKC